MNMKLSMIIVSMLLTMVGIAQQSVYDFKIRSAGGNEIDLNDLRDKVLIVVNIASGSERSMQLRQLDTLCQKYASQGLVVIVFPTNDFNREPKTDTEILLWTSGLHPNLLIAAKTSVKGESRSAFYNWCTKKSENGMVSMEVAGDYQKFIISRQGQVVGVFSGAVSPMAEPVLKSIAANLKN